MLVVISDLHFIDTTAGEHIVPAQWFRNVFESWIPALAEDRKAKELKVLLLGDIVDLIRTEQWLENGFELSDRPWGENGRRDVDKAVEGEPLGDSKTEEQCLKILGELADLNEANPSRNTILSKNRETFSLFRSFRENVVPSIEKKLNQKDFKFELIYMPGNHDRLCNLYPGVRDRLKDALGLTINESTVDTSYGDWWYRDYFKDEAYGVYARHGHEYDDWNHGTMPVHTRAGQLQASVGEAIATEFAVQVPRLVRQYTKEGGSYPIPNADKFVERLQEADNVRPLGRVIEWFYYSISDRDAGNARKAVNTAIEEAVGNLLEIDLVQKWRSPETRWDEAVRAFSSPWLRWVPSAILDMPWLHWLPSGVADKLRAEDLLPLFTEKTSGILRTLGSTDDPHTDAAYAAYKENRDADIRYILYGHTHNPVINPLEQEHGREAAIYINTGTWRQRILGTASSNRSHQFVPLDQITYVVFYREDEDPGKKPDTLSFDMWTGSGRKILG